MVVELWNRWAGPRSPTPHDSVLAAPVGFGTVPRSQDPVPFVSAGFKPHPVSYAQAPSWKLTQHS